MNISTLEIMICCLEETGLDYPLTQHYIPEEGNMLHLRNTFTNRFTGEEEFLEEQVAMMMQLGSPYLGMVNRE